MKYFRLPVSVVTYNNSRPADIPQLRPFPLCNVDEEFDSPDKFYKNSEIPCPKSTLANSYSNHSSKSYSFLLTRLSQPWHTTSLSNQTTNLNLRPFFSQSVRKLHHDFKPPDFSEYRWPKSKDSRSSTSGSSYRRSASNNLALIGGATITGIVSKAVVSTVVGTLQASKATQALSISEFNVSELSPGQTITELWQSKPVFIHRWSDEELAREREVNISMLRDPQTVEQRCLYPEWLIVIGICTHLGCVPIPGHGDFHGYFCPCHASHYDCCGRVRKGPAPRNLEVPKYYFDDDGILVVGESK